MNFIFLSPKYEFKDQNRSETGTDTSFLKKETNYICCQFCLFRKDHGFPC